jgi:hypothetical protein
LEAGTAIEYSIRLSGAAFDIMLAAHQERLGTREHNRSAGEPQVDDRHLLDGIAGAVAWSAAAD